MSTLKKLIDIMNITDGLYPIYLYRHGKYKWGLKKNPYCMICRVATRGWTETGLPDSVLNPSLLQTSMASQRNPSGLVVCFTAF